MKTFQISDFRFQMVVMLAGMLIAVSCTAAPFRNNPWVTNAPGTPVRGVNNISITNDSSTFAWEFFGNSSNSVARFGDVSNTVNAVAGGYVLATNGTARDLTVTGNWTNAGNLYVNGGTIGIGVGAISDAGSGNLLVQGGWNVDSWWKASGAGTNVGALYVGGGLSLLGTNVVAAPAGLNAMGAQLWSDGTNLCVVLQKSDGTRTTNKVTVSSWP